MLAHHLITTLLCVTELSYAHAAGSLGRRLTWRPPLSRTHSLVTFIAPVCMYNVQCAMCNRSLGDPCWASLLGDIHVAPHHLTSAHAGTHTIEVSHLHTYSLWATLVLRHPPQSSQASIMGRIDDTLQLLKDFESNKLHQILLDKWQIVRFGRVRHNYKIKVQRRPLTHSTCKEDLFKLPCLLYIIFQFKLYSAYLALYVLNLTPCRLHL